MLLPFSPAQAEKQAQWPGSTPVKVYCALYDDDWDGDIWKQADLYTLPSGQGDNDEGSLPPALLAPVIKTEQQSAPSGAQNLPPSTTTT